MTAKQRRWYNFSLWQLFALVTLVCGVLAWQMSIVRGRSALRRELQPTGVSFSNLPDHDFPYNIVLTARGQDPQIPLIRRCLGDEPVRFISYYPHASPSPPKLQQLKSSFPEAIFLEKSPPLEPCHPGCFPHGTLVETPAGPRKIEEIGIGDTVFMISAAGEKKSVPVMSIFRTHNRLWEVSTTRGVLVTTETQPLCTSLRTQVPAGKLQPGDEILVWNEGEVQPVTITEVQQTERIVPVINLVLGNREPFIAGGYLVRSKPPAE